MTDFFHVVHLLSPYLEGELTFAERAEGEEVNIDLSPTSSLVQGRVPFPSLLTREEIETHLSACAFCQEELVLLKKTLAMVRSLPLENPSPDFLVRLNQRIDKGSWWIRLLHTLFLPLSLKLPLHAFATLAVVGFAFLLFYSSLQQRWEIPVTIGKLTPPEIQHHQSQTETRGAGGDIYRRIEAPPQPEAKPLPPSRTEALPMARRAKEQRQEAVRRFEAERIPQEQEQRVAASPLPSAPSLPGRTNVQNPAGVMEGQADKQQREAAQLSPAEREQGFAISPTQSARSLPSQAQFKHYEDPAQEQAKDRQHRISGLTRLHALQAFHKKGEAEPGIPQVAEQPLPSPLFYRVISPTVVRESPIKTGKEIAQLRINMRLQVVAIAGDWLRVESRATPPRPPGYVWNGDVGQEETVHGMD